MLLLEKQRTAQTPPRRAQERRRGSGDKPKVAQLF